MSTNYSNAPQIVMPRPDWIPRLPGPHSQSCEYQPMRGDLLERRTAENHRESEGRFRIVADSAPVLIWMSDTDKLCNFFNKPWLDFTGRTLDQELGNGWAEGIHPDDVRACFHTYITAFDARQPFAMQYRLRRHDGEYRWISDNGVPWYDPSGAFAGYIGSCVDITEQKLAQEALAKSYAEIKDLKERLEAESDYLRTEIKVNQLHGEIIGRSPALKKVLHQVEQVAPADCAVLISGETGTGKELIAQEIHRLSRRKDRLMVLVNCAALPSALVESELFGRERGAYTGALTSQVGRFEVANNSTIFLDEVGELSMEVQAKLLRVLQQGEFQRLGSPKTHKVNVRIIAATNRDLAADVRKGKFREDLYYRLKVFPIEIPPLRERADDISLLVFAFLEEFSVRMGKKITKVPRKAMETLQKHAWPGNIRELRNVIEHSVILSSGDVLKLSMLGETATRDAQVLTLAEVEREHILKTLEATGWRIKGAHGAAARLDLQPSTLYSRMQKLGIPHRRQKDEMSVRG
jgi:PAS domain S-box-containing protein